MASYLSARLNKLGVFVNVKKSRETKVRLIVHMKRSGANERAEVPERPLLPRPRGIIEGVLRILRSRGLYAADAMHGEW
eukprot:2986286-Heterocapsa_arctica.AAC.2